MAIITFSNARLNQYLVSKNIKKLVPELALLRESYCMAPNQFCTSLEVLMWTNS